MRRTGPVVVLLVAASCGGITDTDGSDRFDLLSGAWQIELVAGPHLGGPTTVEGSCTLDPVSVTLDKEGEPRTSSFRTYGGRHSGTTIDCRGLNEAAVAWSGVGDSVLVVPPDTVTALLRPSCGGCATERTATITLVGFRLIDGGLTVSPLRDSLGGTFVVDPDGSPGPLRLAGTWTARRVLSR